ncbi:phosphate/phosphite/phosphonate ABC transporter substrate-binding protein [Pseudoalteromonas sp.]|uniref:phosphate/phosphite/phosphonate ABC transporter substrate-binding protein n=1 Tax=Pseudoalteromonas sp. TaxID=53249 RepID=UPI0026128BC2|nr:phosphate/phosphite/phosphonate ABC transporter substrate-binding protein [Pseudoalteromonas sp.]MCP4586900.1 phosphate/phosphite/phosphonate ABC transporter substrate-binding protein [Pseudoalteromonas sp.]
MQKVFLKVVLLTIFVCSSVWAEHKEVEAQYTIGVVPQFEQRKLFRIWQPIVKELEKRTGFAFHIVGSPKIPAFEKSFMAGEFDFAYMNPYHILKAHKTQGYIPLVRDGSRQLKGVLVVKKDSPIQDVKELNKKKVAFPAPNALGASLLMRADLSELHGLTIFPRYVQTHSSVYLNVALGQAEAGGGVMSTLNAQPDSLKSKLKVLYETRGMSPHPLSAHPRVDEQDREKVKQAWLEFSATAEGKALLSKIPMKESIGASMEDYQPMAEWGLDKYYVTD